MHKRIAALQGLMGNLDCVIVTSPEDVYYYSGYMPMKEEPAALLVLRKEARLFTISNGFQKKSAGVDVTIMKKSGDFFNVIKKYRSIGFDENSLRASTYIKLKKRCPKLQPFSERIKEPRMIKEPDEIRRIKEAIKLTKKAFAAYQKGFVGSKERELATEIDILFQKNTAKPAFDTIVASGVNSSSVHYVPAARKILPKDLVIVDIGAKLNHYCADMTRTWCRSPGGREKKIMEDVADMQAKLIGTIRPGVKMKDVQSRYDALLKKRGYKSFHSFGHGVGLNVHERPNLSDTIKEGMVLTVEPGVYVKNFGGCRIEDIVLVKKKKAEVLR